MGLPYKHTGLHLYMLWLLHEEEGILEKYRTNPEHVGVKYILDAGRVIVKSQTYMNIYYILRLGINMNEEAILAKVTKW